MNYNIFRQYIRIYSIIKIILYFIFIFFLKKFFILLFIFNINIEIIERIE